MTLPSAIPNVPVSFFGIVLGLAGLGNAWAAGHRVWGLPRLPADGLMLAAAIVWTILLILYAAKWAVWKKAAVEELGHPVQCCFAGLIGVATMLVAQGALPHSRPIADVLFVFGALITLVFALWRTGLLWRGGRDADTTTPILYLPTVAGALVMGATAAALGFPDWGQLAFGAGVFSWLAIESVLVYRLYTVAAMPPALRPTLGIQLAPPAVAAVTYLAVADTPSVMIASALIGYGLLQALLLLRLLPWIMEQPFGPSYWAFTFGATALAAAPLRVIERGGTGAVAILAPYLFIAANVLVLVVTIATLLLLAQGRLLPKPAPAPRQGSPAPGAT